MVGGFGFRSRKTAAPAKTGNAIVVIGLAEKLEATPALPVLENGLCSSGSAGAGRSWQ